MMMIAPAVAAAVSPLIKPGLLGHAPPNYPPVGHSNPSSHHQQQHHVPAGPESAWERGLRKGKEVIGFALDVCVCVCVY
jgi:hypothetical protein